MKNLNLLLIVVVLAVLNSGCKKEDDPVVGKDPDTASKVSVDRFSASAGHLMVRDGSNGLPEANEPINYDMAPFITKGLAPSGGMTEYYNFDVMPTAPAPIYVLFREGEDTPVDGQLNIIDKIPGDAGYNDFWLVNKVTVPSDYVANVVTSFSEIVDNGYTIDATTTIVNCPVVPEGSTASKRFGGGDNGLTRGWYKGEVCFYFNFVEKALEAVSGSVPTSPIYVTFNINPGMQGGGPASGFVVENGTSQTHNVVATVPSDASYSPLWQVKIYDNADFSSVMDLASAQSATILEPNAALVNCPIVQ